MGQYAYATPALLAKRGMTEAARDPLRLLTHPPKDMLTPVEEMETAFYKGTQVGGGCGGRGMEPASWGPGCVDLAGTCNGRDSVERDGGSFQDGHPQARSTKPHAHCTHSPMLASCPLLATSSGAKSCWRTWTSGPSSRRMDRRGRCSPPPTPTPCGALPSWWEGRVQAATVPPLTACCRPATCHAAPGANPNPFCWPLPLNLACRC